MRRPRLSRNVTWRRSTTRQRVPARPVVAASSCWPTLSAETTSTSPCTTASTVAVSMTTCTGSTRDPYAADPQRDKEEEVNVWSTSLRRGCWRQKQRSHLARPEFEEARLVRPDLVDVDTVVAGGGEP